MLPVQNRSHPLEVIVASVDHADAVSDLSTLRSPVAILLPQDAQLDIVAPGAVSERRLVSKPLASPACANGGWMHQRRYVASQSVKNDTVSGLERNTISPVLSS